LWEQVNEITEFLKWNEEKSGHAVIALAERKDGGGGGGESGAVLRRGIIRIFCKSW
jgi:hypothetical protein